jgi:hypothetical protein
VPKPEVREDMSPAPWERGAWQRAYATIALRHDDASPHKWGWAHVPAPFAAGQGAKAQKIVLKKRVPTLGPAA